LQQREGVIQGFKALTQHFYVIVVEGHTRHDHPGWPVLAHTLKVKLGSATISRVPVAVMAE
jgi:hypothetical protein